MSQKSIPVPQCVYEKLLELNKLVEEHPRGIPVKAVAEFLHASQEGLKKYIIENPNAFGIGWKSSNLGIQAFKIPAVKFYIWYTNGLGLYNTINYWNEDD